MKKRAYFLFVTFALLSSQASIADDDITLNFQQYAGVSYERVAFNFNPGLEFMTKEYDIVEPYFGVVYPNNVGFEIGLFSSIQEKKSQLVTSTGQITIRNVMQGFRISTLYTKTFKRLNLYGKLGVRYLSFESKPEDASGMIGSVPANQYVLTQRDSWEPHATLGASVSFTKTFSLGVSYETMPSGNSTFATDASIISAQMQFKL